MTKYSFIGNVKDRDTFINSLLSEVNYEIYFTNANHNINIYKF